MRSTSSCTLRIQLTTFAGAGMAFFSWERFKYVAFSRLWVSEIVRTAILSRLHFLVFVLFLWSWELKGRHYESSSTGFFCAASSGLSSNIQSKRSLWISSFPRSWDLLSKWRQLDWGSDPEMVNLPSADLHGRYQASNWARCTGRCM